MVVFKNSTTTEYSKQTEEPKTFDKSQNSDLTKNNEFEASRLKTICL